MKYNLNEETFFVKELFKPELKSKGRYYYYILEKKGISHKQILKRLPRDSLFCGIKDKNATTEQWFCSKQPIEEINEEKIRVIFKGRSGEKLFIGKHKGNRFKILVELNEKEEKEIKKVNWKKEFVANYFGKQRFDERVDEFCEKLEKPDYESALKMFLCTSSKFDTEKSSEIKKEIFEKWNKWKLLEESEIIPESKKPIFVFLEKEKNFEKAFDFVEQRSLKQMLKACQAKRWNKILFGKVSEVKNNNNNTRATRAIKKNISIKATTFEKKFGLRNLKRDSYFVARKLKLKKSIGNKYWIIFELRKGIYATTFLKYLEEKLDLVFKQD